MMTENSHQREKMKLETFFGLEFYLEVQSFKDDNSVEFAESIWRKYLDGQKSSKFLFPTPLFGETDHPPELIEALHEIIGIIALSHTNLTVPKKLFDNLLIFVFKYLDIKPQS